MGSLTRVWSSGIFTTLRCVARARQRPEQSHARAGATAFNKPKVSSRGKSVHRNGRRARAAVSWCCRCNGFCCEPPSRRETPAPAIGVPLVALFMWGDCEMRPSVAILWKTNRSAKCQHGQTDRQTNRQTLTKWINRYMCDLRILSCRRRSGGKQGSKRATLHADTSLPHLGAASSSLLLVFLGRCGAGSPGLEPNLEHGVLMPSRGTPLQHTHTHVHTAEAAWFSASRIIAPSP